MGFIYNVRYLCKECKYSSLKPNKLINHALTHHPDLTPEYIESHPEKFFVWNSVPIRKYYKPHKYFNPKKKSNSIFGDYEHGLTDL